LAIKQCVEQDQNIINKVSELGINISKINGREICAFCPKHDDTNPSFFFNLDTQKFHCFAGCLKGRGLHQLIYQITGISQAGRICQEERLKKFTFNREFDKKMLPTIPILPLAIGNDGEKYLSSRNFNQDSIHKFKIRYWAEEKAIVIPLENIGYILRYIDKNAFKKYKYIAGTRITDTLFGLSYLPKILTNIILVEGSLDCIFLHQLGFESSLALLHSDISKEQIKKLGGVTDYVYIMMDGDLIGRQITKKIQNVLKFRFIVKACNLPENKDPNELTKEEITKILNEAK